MFATTCLSWNWVLVLGIDGLVALVVGWGAIRSSIVVVLTNVSLRRTNNVLELNCPDVKRITSIKTCQSRRFHHRYIPTKNRNTRVSFYHSWFVVKEIICVGFGQVKDWICGRNLQCFRVNATSMLLDEPVIVIKRLHCRKYGQILLQARYYVKL